MNDKIIEAIGLFGSFLSSITFLPQVLKVHKSQSAKDLSMNMLLIILASTIVWLIYGIGLGLLPVIICNAIIFCLSGWLVLFKWQKEKK
jgi:MtN3 and saliva related transmembrane protein